LVRWCWPQQGAPVGSPGNYWDLFLGEGKPGGFPLGEKQRKRRVPGREEWGHWNTGGFQLPNSETRVSRGFLNCWAFPTVGIFPKHKNPGGGHPGKKQQFWGRHWGPGQRGFDLDWAPPIWASRALPEGIAPGWQGALGKPQGLGKFPTFKKQKAPFWTCLCHRAGGAALGNPGDERAPSPHLGPFGVGICALLSPPF